MGQCGCKRAKKENCTYNYCYYSSVNILCSFKWNGKDLSILL